MLLTKNRIRKLWKKKRISARAIIIYEDKIVTMYREVKGRKYYTFPGGHIEQNESEQECVKREIFKDLI